MIGLAEAERIALEFVNMKEPPYDNLGQHDVPLDLNRNQLKSVRRHGEGWSVVVEQISNQNFPLSGFNSVRTWLWTILIDSEGKILEYDRTEPHEERTKLYRSKPAPIESHIHIYEHKGDEEKRH